MGWGTPPCEDPGAISPLPAFAADVAQLRATEAHHAHGRGRGGEREIAKHLSRAVVGCASVRGNTTVLVRCGAVEDGAPGYAERIQLRGGRCGAKRAARLIDDVRGSVITIDESEQASPTELGEALRRRVAAAGATATWALLGWSVSRTGTDGSHE